MKAEELQIYRDADAVLTITTEDRSRILSATMRADRQTVDPERVVPIPMVSEATVGVQEAWHGKPFDQRGGLVMVGNGANPVNRASVEWFLTEIWPLLRAALGLEVSGEEGLQGLPWLSCARG